ncbi:hypothetical protein L7F22_028332 [Adiantum nelumboides]|nr:hypothetical protein [Adiantum nelumboides]
MGEEKPDGELYALLHLSPKASDEEIRRAYRQWAQVYHPDKHQTPQVLQYLREDPTDAWVLEFLVDALVAVGLIRAVGLTVAE